MSPRIRKILSFLLALAMAVVWVWATMWCDEECRNSRGAGGGSVNESYVGYGATIDEAMADLREKEAR